MLLAIDVGNTNTVLGVFDAGRLRDSFRVQTEKDRTGDEYGLQLKALFDFAGLRMADVHDVIVSSVVPPMAFPLEQMSKRFFGRKPLFVGPGIKTGMPVLYDNPREVGADRVVNAVAAYEKWPQGLVIVDFGTATTFDAVTPRGEYLGGAIAPGIAISMEALFHRASKPRGLSPSEADWLKATVKSRPRDAEVPTPRQVVPTAPALPSAASVETAAEVQRWVDAGRAAMEADPKVAHELFERAHRRNT